jgi:NADPH-dependent 2,4-dienoyl-CoA reductase/sulfur reductase-like enzyme
VEAYKYIIIGGGMAGQRAIGGIRRLDSDGTIALVSAENHLPYERPPLSKGYLTGKEGLDHVYLKEEGYYAEENADLILGVAAEKVDPSAHRVLLADGRELAYEKLLLATGARAFRLPLPGNDLGNVFTLRTIEDSDAIRAAAGDGARALVLGGSFIGSEVAASLTQLGAKVTMLFPDERLLQAIAPEALSRYVAKKYGGKGIIVRSGIVAERLEGDGVVQRAVLSDGSVLEADLVVMGVGVRLNTALARDAGLEMGERDAVVVDRQLRTSDADIYAAGDIAAWPDRRFDKTLRVEHWDVARRQGDRAGRNMAGEGKGYFSVPYFFSDLFDLSFEAWGDLTAWDRTVMRGTLESGHCAIYYFEQDKLCGVLAFGRPDAERSPMQALVRARPMYDEVAEKLRDEGVDLAALVEE